LRAVATPYRSHWTVHPSATTPQRYPTRGGSGIRPLIAQRELVGAPSNSSRQKRWLQRSRAVRGTHHADVRLEVQWRRHLSNCECMSLELHQHASSSNPIMRHPGTKPLAGESFCKWALARLR